MEIIDYSQRTFHHASFGSRLAAFIIDLLIHGAANFFLQRMGVDGDFWQIAIGWIYSASMESSKWQGTVGKIVLGICVVDENGERITFGRATGRYFAQFISAFIFFIGYLMMLWDDQSRSLHDRLAGTLVINDQRKGVQ